MLYGAAWRGCFAHTAPATLTKTSDFSLLMPVPAAGALHYAQGCRQVTLAPHHVGFVYISIHRLPAAWRQTVAARQLAGPSSVHLRPHYSLPVP
jgi:hypothetical protein